MTDGLPFVPQKDGRSGDAVFLVGESLILKTSRNRAELAGEYERLRWLEGKLPVGRPLFYSEMNGSGFLLREAVSGRSLLSQTPSVITEAAGEAWQWLRKLDGEACPFVSPESCGSDFVHGDLCLPNILVNEQGHFSGFIDLSTCGLGDRKLDESWLCWSFVYNTHQTESLPFFCQTLGFSFDREAYMRYLPEESRLLTPDL